MSSRRHPTPLNRALAAGEVEAHRNLNCIFYDGCLAESVKEAWVGWSCSRCPLRDVRGPVQLERHAHSRRVNPFDG